MKCSTSKETVDPSKLDLKHLPEGAIVAGGEVVSHTFSLIIRNADGSEISAPWSKKVSEFPEEFASSLPPPFRVLDVEVGRDSARILCVFFDRVRIESAALQGATPSVTAVDLFTESESTGRIARAGAIVSEKAGITTILVETVIGYAEVWQVAEGNARLVEKARMPAPRDEPPPAVSPRPEDERRLAVLKKLAETANPSADLCKEAIAAVKECTPGATDDDLALMILAGVGEDHDAALLMEAYEACAPSLNRVKVEGSTKLAWKRYESLLSESRRAVAESEDILAGLWARTVALEILREKAERLKDEPGKAAEARKIRAFIAREARSLIEEMDKSSDMRELLDDAAKAGRAGR
jgi:hypothetical protein